MLLSLVAIGNSRGIRLPKHLIQQLGLENQVKVELRGHELVLTAPGGREGWADLFAALAGSDEEALP